MQLPILKETKSKGKIIIRLEQPSDFRKAEELTREAFWNQYMPGGDEHYLLHKIRESPDFIPELTLVAELQETGELVGQITYTKSRIEDLDGSIVFDKICTFGPISVHPEYQKQGIALALIEASAAIAKEQLNLDAIVIYGDPRFYYRSGFRSSEKHNLKTPSGSYAVALLIRVLNNPNNYLTQLKDARFYESDIFSVSTEQDVLEFDSSFPNKEKVEDTEGQRNFAFLRSLNFQV